MLRLIKLLTTAWTVWKVATKRVGPVAGFVVTGAVIASVVFLKPWLDEHAPAVARIVVAV